MVEIQEIYVITNTSHKARRLNMAMQNIDPLRSIVIPEGLFFPPEPRDILIERGLRDKSEGLVRANQGILKNVHEILVSDVLLTIGTYDNLVRYPLHQPGDGIDVAEYISGYISQFLHEPAAIITANSGLAMIKQHVGREGFIVHEETRMTLWLDSIRAFSKTGVVNQYLEMCENYRQWIAKTENVQLKPNSRTSGGLYLEMLWNYGQLHGLPMSLEVISNGKDPKEALTDAVRGSTDGALASLINRSNQITSIVPKGARWHKPIALSPKEFVHINQ
jgi:hypothetical protein